MSSRLRKKRNQRAERVKNTAAKLIKEFDLKVSGCSYGVHPFEYKQIIRQRSGNWYKVCVDCGAVYSMTDEEVTELGLES